VRRAKRTADASEAGSGGVPSVGSPRGAHSPGELSGSESDSGLRGLWG